MRKFSTKVKNQITGKVLLAKIILESRSAEGFVDTAIKILISVVIGALILAGLYALFGNTVLPTLTRRIQELFNYGG